MRIFALIALLLATPALAQGPKQEPVGCDKFKWPIDKERALLVKATPVESGATMSQPAANVKLAADTARLPQPPTRQSNVAMTSEPSLSNGFASTRRIPVTAISITPPPLG